MTLFIYYNFRLQAVCRDVRCYHQSFSLVEGSCEQDFGGAYEPFSDVNSTCFSAFFKLIPCHNSVAAFTSERRIGAHSMYAVNSLVNVSVRMNPNSFDFFELDTGAVRFVVVLLTVEITNYSFTVDYYDFFDRIYYIGTNNISVSLGSAKQCSIVTVAYYNVSYYYRTIKVYVPSEESGYIRELRTGVDEKSQQVKNCFEQSMVVMNKLFVCPFIHLPNDEFIIEINNDFLTLKENGVLNHTRVFSKWEYTRHGDKVYICLDDYRDFYQTMSISLSNTDKLPRGELDLKNILALVCVCFSMVCLLITIVTYASIPVLQSQPGINTMILATFLFFAQGFYQFGAGQKSIVNWACAILGGISHIMWLSVMFSTNLCCIQMFIIFKKYIVISKTYRQRETVKSIVYILCVSCLFVLVNIVVSLVRSKGQTSGYGGKLCYISSPLMQVITFVLPSVIALLVNSVIFVFVVYKIRKVVRSTSMLNKERNYLNVYIRLSALTGLTWIVGYIQLVLNLEWLEYIFIVLNASQGVFLMIAFVVNKRVLSYICKRETTTSAVMLRSVERTHLSSHKSAQSTGSYPPHDTSLTKL